MIFSSSLACQKYVNVMSAGRKLYRVSSPQRVHLKNSRFEKYCRSKDATQYFGLSIVFLQPTWYHNREEKKPSIVNETEQRQSATIHTSIWRYWQAEKNSNSNSLIDNDDDNDNAAANNNNKNSEQKIACPYQRLGHFDVNLIATDTDTDAYICIYKLIYL